MGPCVLQGTAAPASAIASSSRRLCGGVVCFPAAPAARCRLIRLRVRSATTCELPQPQAQEAILCQRFKAHKAAVTAALIISDDGGLKELVTASLDKTLALWHLKAREEEQAALGHQLGCEEIVRMAPRGGPVWSLAADAGGLDTVRRQVFCGNHAREVLCWEPPSKVVHDKVVLNGHTGWVRALATQGRWLFSASCASLRQWDMSRAVPRLVRDVALERGDILGLAAGGGRVFAAGADGSIRAWQVSKKGELADAPSRLKAHSDRATALLAHGGFLYSVSYDGSVKMWEAATMELVMEVPRAHEGARIHCAAIAPDGHLYTGGDDKLVRRWQLSALEPGAGGPLFCHNYAVRSLAAGPRELLLSGDAGGELAVWKVASACAPSARTATAAAPPESLLGSVWKP